MSKTLQATNEVLKQARREHEAVLVSYSGGKDSLCVAELCSHTFARVELYYMFLVPGLECVEIMLEYARQRWGVKVHQYPHWLLSKAIRNGFYRPYESETEQKKKGGAIVEWKLKDVWALARADTGIDLIATGQKAADNMARRRILSTTPRDLLLYPIEKWNKFEVISYLKAQKIPVPDSSGKQTNGIDLATPSLLWLHDRWPGDFKKLCEWFPFAEAVVWRREFHGIGERF